MIKYTHILLALTSAISFCTAHANVQDDFNTVRECASTYYNQDLNNVVLNYTNDTSIYATAHTSRRVIVFNYTAAHLLKSDQLQFVLAHEIAHIANQHYGHSRDHERQADTDAISILHHCNLDMNGYKSLLEASQDSMGVHDNNDTRIKLINTHIKTLNRL